jgi:aromatic-L-amino-acid decarboxylase
VFTSGGSLANFSAVVCARHARLGEDFRDGTLYVSDQVHHCVTKAATLAGFPASSLRVLPSDPAGRLSPAAVRAAVAADRADGRRPALLVASAGTVNTGAVDPLAELARLARQEDLWLHVDAAYGGFFQLTRRGRERFAGIEAADSITVDPHKGLFLPYGTGCLMVRDGEILRRSHGTGGEYLPAMQQHPLAQDFCEYSPELSRDFRGLRVWLPLKIAGLRAFRECLDEKLDLARVCRERLAAVPELELVGDGELSLIAFRLRGDPDHGPRTALLLDRVNAEGRVMLSGTTFQGRWVDRLCILNFRTHAERIEEALESIVRHARSLGAPAAGDPGRAP